MANSGGQMLAYTCRWHRQPQSANASAAGMFYCYTTPTRSAEIWHLCSLLSCQGRFRGFDYREQAKGSEMKDESPTDMFPKIEVSCKQYDYTSDNELAL